MSTTAGAPGEFSMKRGLVHAGIVLVAVTLVLAIVAAALDVEDPAGAGRASAPFVLFAAFVAFAVSWLAQTGRRRAAWGVALGVVGLIAVVVVVALASGPARWATAADRAPLVASGAGAEARLVHPTLGFSLQAPGDSFTASPAVAAMFGDDPERPSWGWLDATRGIAVLVTLEPDLGIRARPSSVETFVDGLVAGTKLQVRQREVRWAHTEPSFRVEGTVAGRRILVSGRGAELGPKRQPLSVLVVTVGDDDGEFDALHNSLTIPD